MTPSKAKLVAELELLREATIADTTIKVCDARWNAAVARCLAIRKQLRLQKVLKYVPGERHNGRNLMPKHRFL